MKNIYFGGNSTTCGDELKYPEKERYSTIVTKYYNANLVFNATSGSSNSKISSDLYKYLSMKNNLSLDLVIILWSDGTRYSHFFEYSMNVDNDELHQPISPNFWSIELEKINDILGDSETQLNREIKNFYLRRNYPYYNIIKEYNNKLWNLSNQLYIYLNNILSVQCICKFAKIPYIMMNVSPFKESSWNKNYIQFVIENNIHELHKKELTDLLNSIDWSNWINEGVLNYTNEFRSKKYLNIFRHPTKEGHRIIANDLIKFINKNNILDK